MFSFFIIIPIAAIISTLGIYRRTGRREFLKFDAVQFIYAFILAPFLFIWLKSFLFYLLRQEIDIHLNSTEMFVIDTTFSVIFLYIFAFIVIHSLTKSFELKRYSDPLYDVFTHSEALHLWFSHTAIYTGGMTLFVLLSLVNVFVPALVETTRFFFYLMLVLGFVGGTFGFAGIWLSNFTDSPIFLRIMKIVVAFYFSIHVAVYFLISPAFNATNLIFWMVFMAFFAMALCSFVFERSERASGWFERFHHKKGWKKGNFLLSKSEFKL